MDDLISRQAATSIPILPKEHRKIFKSIDDAFETGWNEALSCVNMLPSAQPEIIRCKDCDWWTKQEDSVQGRCELMQMYPAGGWYCGNARRRQE